MGIPFFFLGEKSDMIGLLLSFSPESLFNLLVTNKRLSSILIKNELLWTTLLHKLRNDCAVCWQEGKDFQQWVGCSARDELRMRLAHRRIRKEWCVKFSSRVLTCMDDPTERLSFHIIYPQSETKKVIHKTPAYKLSRIVPIASTNSDDMQLTISASENSMTALLDTFLMLEFPTLIIGGKRERKHSHCSLRCVGEQQSMFKIKASGWYSENVLSKAKCDSGGSSSLERQVTRDLSDAVGGHGSPSGIYWHSIVLRSYRSYAHYLLSAVDDNEVEVDYGPLRQLLVAVKLYQSMRGAKMMISARVAGAIVLPCKRIYRGYSWVDRVTDLENDGDDDSEGY